MRNVFALLFLVCALVVSAHQKFDPIVVVSPGAWNFFWRSFFKNLFMILIVRIFDSTCVANRIKTHEKLFQVIECIVNYV